MYNIYNNIIYIIIYIINIYNTPERMTHYILEALKIFEGVSYKVERYVRWNFHKFLTHGQFYLLTT